MTYGSEAVVPVEIGLTTFRTSTYYDHQNEGEIRLNLDLIDEVREKAETRMKRYQMNMARHILLISLHSRFCFFLDFVNQIEVEEILHFADHHMSKLGHIHLISLHSRFCFFSDFVNQIKVEEILHFADHHMSKFERSSGQF